GALAPLGRWPLRNDNDTAWEAAFSPDGSIFGLSSAPAIGTKEALHVVATVEAGKTPPAIVIDDVAYWKVSNDGAVIYFMRGLPDEPALFAADFPSGERVRLIEPG